MTSPPVRRIVISATCYPDAQAAIPLGVNLARQLNAEVEGLLVEEEAFIHYAALPSAKALSGQGRQANKVTPKAMLDAFQRDAQAFRNRLSRSAREASVTWTFQQRRGALMSLVDQMGKAADVILFGHHRSFTAPGEIVLVCGKQSPPADLMDLANRIATDLHLPLVVLAQPDAREIINDWMKQTPQDRITIVYQPDPDNTLTYLSLRCPAAVLVAKSSLSDVNLKSLVNTARSPVMVAMTA